MTKIFFKGNEVTLLGEQLKVGQKAPDFTSVDSNLNKLSLSDFKGKLVVLTSFPSIDTSVCAMQARKFNEAATSLKDAVVLTISLDLPFALGRFCAAEGIKNVISLSDYQNRDFATKYGLLIDELKLLARTVYVIDKDGVIRYEEICKEVANEPNYEKALETLKNLG